MEGIEKITETILESIDNILLKYDSDCKGLFDTLDKIVEAANSSISSTQKIKKKPKRLLQIGSTDSEDSLVSEKDGPAVNHPTSAEALILAKTFSDEIETRTSSRPVRAAKLKVENLLKEQSLKGKLRRPSRADSAVNYTQQKIKEERKSTELEVAKQKNTTVANEVSANLDATKRKSSEISSDKQKDEEPPKKVDESLVILNNNEQPTLEISDDESGKMPPPAAVPKKKATKKKVETSENLSDVLKISQIKAEKESLDGKSDKADSLQSLNPVEPETENIKAEKVSDIRKSGSIGEKKVPPKKRGRKKRYRPIKEEKTDEEEQTEKPQEVDSQADSVAQVRASMRSEKGKNTSFESVYEDAVSESTNKIHIEKNEIMSGVGKTDTIDENREKATDATFVSAVEVPVANINSKGAEKSFPQDTFIVEKNAAAKPKALNKAPTEEKQCNDQTFVSSNGPQSTFIMNNDDNKNKMPPMESNDATFNVNLSEGGKGSDGDKNEKILENSILTEDESIEEERVPLPKPRMPVKGGKKEIFNPFVQSPVKKKVEAFEKHASTVNRSPPSQRQTRQTRQHTTKENKEPQNQINSTSKMVTPNLGRNIGRFLTPTQQSNITPNVFSHLKTPSSVSKIPNISNCKQAKASASATKSASLSRESSSEDVKKTAVRLQQLEEKKKKREQKQQMATQLREAKEKERAEKLKKLMEEREEKARRKAMEVEQQKRQLEEINRNLKLQEERREAQKRAEKQKLLEMAEAAKKEREIMEAIKIQKAKQKEKLIQERKLLEQKKLMIKKNAYNFNMLNSDDSTDDEGKTSSRRPPPPAWSKSAARQLLIERQSHLPTKVIDSFFSVQPMTPDLRQIFPTLDSRYLKRNSSVFWKTPPRYSQLPKY